MEERERLEHYVRRHRWELDEVEEARTEAIWEQVDRGLNRGGRRLGGWRLSVGRNWLWAAAAAGAMVFGVSALIRWRAAETALTQHQAPALSQYYPELAGQEQAYRQQVAEKETALGMKELRKEDFESIFEELRLLDEIHAQYLRDLPRFYDNEQLVQTLLKYYEQKIRILERLSLEIEKKKHHEERTRDEHLL